MDDQFDAEDYEGDEGPEFEDEEHEWLWDKFINEGSTASFFDVQPTHFVVHCDDEDGRDAIVAEIGPDCELGVEIGYTVERETDPTFEGGFVVRIKRGFMGGDGA